MRTRPRGCAGSARRTSAASAEADQLPRLVLDTTVLIDVLRGRPAARRLAGLARTHEPPLICAINIEEVWRGARPDEHEAIDRLLASLRVVPLGEREGAQAGSWRREHALRGTTLSQADCLVAAAAVSASAHLATGNPRDFPMDALVVEHWPAGA